MAAHYSTLMRPFAPLLQRSRSYVQAFNAQSISPPITLPAPPTSHQTDRILLNPRQIRKHLDSIVIGQDLLKKALSVAIYNHYIRIDTLQSTIDPITKFPTGVNHTQQHFHSANASSTSLTIPHSVHSSLPVPIGNIQHVSVRDNIKDFQDGTLPS